MSEEKKVRLVPYYIERLNEIRKQEAKEGYLFMLACLKKEGYELTEEQERKIEGFDFDKFKDTLYYKVGKRMVNKLNGDVLYLDEKKLREQYGEEYE